MPRETRTFWTIGHSTRSFDEFAAILEAHGITTVADIRHYPGSRRHPHFSTHEFERLLSARDIAYVHVPELGGQPLHPEAILLQTHVEYTTQLSLGLRPERKK